MKTIWKFSLSTVDSEQVKMPEGAQLLCVQTQGGGPCLWALVDDTARTVTRTIQTRGTGHMADNVGAYVGTYQLHGGALVFHVFDGGES